MSEGTCLLKVHEEERGILEPQQTMPSTPITHQCHTINKHIETPARRGCPQRAIHQRCSAICPLPRHTDHAHAFRRPTASMDDQLLMCSSTLRVGASLVSATNRSAHLAHRLP